ncbi:MAG: gliding motility-associated C-terminal domain-containing protein, partial [Bacteroidota bacterium]
NLSDRKQKAVITVTPYTVTGTGATRCTGPQRTIDIWVEPTPRLSLLPAQDTICDLETTYIEILSPSQPTHPVRFEYTIAIDNTDSLTVTTTGSGSDFLTGEHIQETFDNLSDRAQRAVITVTPYTITSSGATRCTGIPRTIDIWVEPTPRLSLLPAQDTICDLETTQIEILSPTQPTLPVRFDYTMAIDDTDSLAVTTAGTGTGLLTGDLIQETFDNLSDRAQRVVITVTPYTVTSTGATRCTGIQRTIDIWVEPTPRLFSYITNDTICNGDPVNITFATPTVSTAGIDFNLRVINEYPEISGYPPDTDRLLISDIIDENVNNAGDTARMIMYIFTPYTIDAGNNQKCEGIRDTVRVWINPTPRAVLLPPVDSMCSGDATLVRLISPTIMTHGELRFDYTVSFSGVPGDITGNDDPETGLEPYDIISRNYENNADTAHSVYYHITPRAEGTGCPAGLINTAEIKVYPLPLQDFIISNPLTCNSNYDLELTAVLAKTDQHYEIVWDGGGVTFNPEDHYNETVVSDLPGGQYMVTVTDTMMGCSNSDVIESYESPPNIVFNAEPKAPLNSYAISCDGGNDGVIEMQIWGAQSGNFPYNYWVIRNATDTVATGTFTYNFETHNITGLGEGIYEWIVVDNNNCEYYSTTPQELKAPDPIEASYDTSYYEGYNVTCKGYSDGWVKVENVSGGNGDYEYLWGSDISIPGDNTQDSIGGLAAGKYWLDITDVLGCHMSDTIYLSEPDGITLVNDSLSLSPDGNYNISCNGYNDGAIYLDFGGGSGSYTYQWTGPEGADLEVNEKDQTGLIAGTYNLLVTDANDCDMPFEFTLTEPDSLEIVIEPSFTYDNAYNINCNGGTADSIGITVSGGSPAGYFYEWTSPDGTGLVQDAEDQFGLTAGKYIVKVTDFNGCVLIDSVTLTEPPPLSIDHEVTDITCESPGMDNGIITLTVEGGSGEPYSYLWSNGATSKDISGLMEGWYYVTVTDDYACTIEDSAYVALPPPLEFEKDSSNYKGYGVSCYGKNDGFINITMTSGDGPYVFSWTGPDGFTSDESSIDQLYAGEYIITVEDNNYCTVTDTTIMTQPDSLIMNLDISVSNDGGFNINCYGDSTGSIDVIPVNSVGDVDFFWTDGNMQANRTGLPAGTYGVMIVDENYCSVDTVVTLTQPDSISITAEIVQPFCKDMPDGEITILPAGGIPAYSYLWFDNSTSNYKDNVAAGEYWIEVTDANGCSIRDTIVVTSEQEVCISIPNAISPNGDNINDFWNIELIELYPEAEVRIFNRWGELVWASEKGYPQPWDGTSNGRRLPVDSYHYIINLHDGTKPVIGDVTIIR